MSQVNWGILGTGRITVRLIEAIAKAENSNLVGIASRSSTRGESFAKNHRTSFLGTYEELLDNNEIDVVYNPLPNHLHQKWTLTAIESGKHVLVEKPLAMSTSEISSIQDAAKNNNKLVMEGFMYQYQPIISKIEELLASHVLGEIKYADFVFAHPITGYLNGEDNYRYYKKYGGGALLDLGVYGVNFFDHIFGKELDLDQINVNYTNMIPFSTEALYAQESIPADRETTTHVMFGDIPITLTCAFDFFGNGLRISGTKGELLVDNLIIPVEKQLTIKGYDVISDQIYKFQEFNPFKEEVESFSDSVIRGSTPKISLDISMRTMAIVEKIIDWNTGYV